MARDARGLPGFLRRSLRVNDTYDDDDDYDDEGQASSTDTATSSPVVIVEEEEEETEKQDNSEEKINHQNGGGLVEEENGTMTKDERSSHSIDPPLNNKTVSNDNNDNNHHSTAPTEAEEAQTQPGSMSVLPSTSPSAGTTARRWTDVPRPKKKLERTLSYKEAMFEKAIGADVVNMSDLRRLGWNGIPLQHRAQAWKIMLGYVPVNASRRQQMLQRKRSEYLDAIAQHYDIDDDTRTLQEQETLRQVLVDVPRTAPDVPLFRNERIRRSLTRLLYIWAMRHPASSYVQGINDLATPLIVVFLSDDYHGPPQDVMDGSIMEEVSDGRMQEIEADCYWCLTNLLSGIQDHYTSDQPGVQRMVMRLEELVNRIDADLSAHLREMGIEFLQFSFKWMNCLLLREFNLSCVLRLWDTYISEGDGGFEDFHVYVCAAFLCQFSSQLQSMDFDELFGFMQHMPTDDWGDTEIEILLSQAFVLSTLFGGSDAHLISQRP